MSRRRMPGIPKSTEIMRKLLIVMVCLAAVSEAAAQRMPERRSVRRGNRHYAHERFEEAVGQYERALEAAPECFEARYDLGNALYRAGRYDGAEQAMRAAAADTLRSDDERAEAFFNLGDAQFRQEKYREALESYKQSLRLNPADAEAKYNYAYTKRLLELTGQLLDFRKIGANKFKMDFAWTNVTTLLKDTILRFEPTIVQQDKKLSVDIPEEEITAAIDREAVTKILSNLLNNALKYSAYTIHIELRREETTFSIRVTSDGNRIPAELSQQIFEPFYQINKKEGATTGAGIGLPLARSLAMLHSGKLWLDTENSDNSFVLTLPLAQEKVRQQENSVIQEEFIFPEEGTTVNAEGRNYTLLLVEDNDTMRSFLAEKLQEMFVTETAPDGKAALEILRNHHIDIVVSDIMMPVMNGLELCKEMKADIELSHIPVIFLTAKNDLDSKINGLRLGAEAYVEKPFSFNYLTTQIFSLLNNRQKEREAFSKRPFFPVNNMQMNKADKEFMDKIIAIIHENITDENFGVEKLAEILCLSRSSLLRKIKVLSGLSPNDFIRLIRLKKAAELILDGKHRIGEICYLVGINSPSYFSKIFLKQFGVTPKDFEKQNQAS